MRAVPVERSSSVPPDLVRIVKGVDVPIAGAPEQVIHDAIVPGIVAVLGGDYPGLRPDLTVAEGDRVKLGQTLFADRRHPEIKVTSPAAGVVREINRGARRSLLSIVIECHDDDEVAFTLEADTEPLDLSRRQIVDLLCSSGLWTALRTRPFDKYPDPEASPAAIFVTAIDTNPLAVRPQFVIDARMEDFHRGLKLIARLTDGPLHLCIAPDHGVPAVDVPNLRITAFAGPHPAGLVGTHIHFLHPVGPRTTVWHIRYQDVIAIGALTATGRLDVSRVIALAGPKVKRPRLIRTTLGAKLADLTENELRDGPALVISGSVFSGRQATGPLGFLGRFETQISALEQEPHGTAFAYSTYQPDWLARLFIRRSESGPGMAGPLLPLGGFERVMPLDVLATPLLRALLVEDVETAQALGALELAEEDLALCSFVCPGRIDYGAHLRSCLSAIERGE